MDLFGELKLCGGLGMFLYGMNVIGESLSKVSSGNDVMR